MCVLYIIMYICIKKHMNWTRLEISIPPKLLSYIPTYCVSRSCLKQKTLLGSERSELPLFYHVVCPSVRPSVCPFHSFSQTDWPNHMRFFLLTLSSLRAVLYVFLVTLRIPEQSEIRVLVGFLCRKSTLNRIKSRSVYNIG